MHKSGSRDNETKPPTQVSGILEGQLDCALRQVLIGAAHPAAPSWAPVPPVVAAMAGSEDRSFSLVYPCEEYAYQNH